MLPQLHVTILSSFHSISLIIVHVSIPFHIIMHVSIPFHLHLVFISSCACLYSILTLVYRTAAKGYELFRIRYPGLVHYYHTRAGMWGDKKKTR